MLVFSGKGIIFRKILFSEQCYHFRKTRGSRERKTTRKTWVAKKKVPAPEAIMDESGLDIK
jgi:hypothetical protein